MKAAKSATKHGIAEADGIHAASYPLWIEPLDDDSAQWRELRLGFDTHARLLKTVVAVAPDGDELLIHGGSNSECRNNGRSLLRSSIWTKRQVPFSCGFPHLAGA